MIKKYDINSLPEGGEWQIDPEDMNCEIDPLDHAATSQSLEQGCPIDPEPNQSGKLKNMMSFLSPTKWKSALTLGLAAPAVGTLVSNSHSFL